MLMKIYLFFKRKFCKKANIEFHVDTSHVIKDYPIEKREVDKSKFTIPPIPPAIRIVRDDDSLARSIRKNKAK